MEYPFLPQEGKQRWNFSAAMISLSRLGEQTELLKAEIESVKKELEDCQTAEGDDCSIATISLSRLHIAYGEQTELLKAQIESLKKELQDCQTAAKAHQETQNAALQRLEKENAELQGAVKRHEEENAKLRGIVVEATAIVSPLVERGEELQNLCDAKEEGLNELKGKYTQLQSVCKDTMKRLKKAEDDTCALDRDLKEAREEIDRQLEQITKLTNEKNALDGHLGQAKG